MKKKTLSYGIYNKKRKGEKKMIWQLKKGVIISIVAM